MSEHLIVLPERVVAEEIANDLREEGFEEVRVVRLELAGEDDAEAADWGVHLIVENVDDEGSTAQGLHERFEALAADHDGWYDPDPSRWETVE